MKPLFLVLACSFSLLAHGQVKVIAHRGASRLAPENTIAAIQLAYQLNADAVEVDVHLSADDEVMVHHDKKTYRTSGGKTNYTLKETNSDVLNQIDVGEWKDPKFKGEMLPYLRDVLYLIPEGKRLVIELKSGPEIIPALLKVIEESGQKEECDFISFSWETICEAHNAFPYNACYYIRKAPWGMKKKIRAAAAVGLRGVDLYYKNINKKKMALAQSLDLEVWCWLVDRPRDFDKMKKLELQAITTNSPSLFTSNKYRLPSGE